MEKYHISLIVWKLLFAQHFVNMICCLVFNKEFDIQSFMTIGGSPCIYIIYIQIFLYIWIWFDLKRKFDKRIKRKMSLEIRKAIIFPITYLVLVPAKFFGELVERKKIEGYKNERNQFGHNVSARVPKFRTHAWCMERGMSEDERDWQIKERRKIKVAFCPSAAAESLSKQKSAL